MKITKQQLYQQYLFLRREMKKTFSEAVWILSVQHNRHEQVIRQWLEQAEEKI